LYYSYVEDKNIIIDAIENNDYNIDWKYEVKEFDLDTKKINIVNDIQPICLNNDWYVTEDMANKKIIAKDISGNTVEFDSINDFSFDCFQYTIYNDKIWDLYNGYEYDLKTKEINQIEEDYLGADIVDYISDDNKYVVCNYDTSGNLSYTTVDEDTLIIR
jgi:hypothetical protein